MYSSGKISSFSIFKSEVRTSLEHQYSVGVRKAVPPLYTCQPPFLSLPRCFDLTTDLHSAQLKMALMMFRLIYYSF